MPLHFRRLFRGLPFRVLPRGASRTKVSALTIFCSLSLFDFSLFPFSFFLALAVLLIFIAFFDPFKLPMGKRRENSDQVV
ncbi:MAG: hypothetical protein D6679_02475 [Candidatus Hydrogenedentota bacterium]|nr:MAG: hypothetical protein D6679_02475 [Candidatus Hydrogenedentota bacterium]